MASVLALQDVDLCVGPRVIEECNDECGGALRDSIGDGRVRFFDDRSIGADLYLSLLTAHGLGEGETECLAAASTASALVVASDDRRARAVAEALFGRPRVTGSLGLLRRCVAAATLTTREAFRSYALMLDAGAFLPVIDEAFFRST